MAAAVQFVRIKTVGILPFCLGVVQGDVGMLCQGIPVGSVLGVQGDADTGRNHHLCTVNQHRGPGCFNQFSGYICRPLVMLYVVQDNGKLVPSQAANQVILPQQAGKTGCHLLQQLVPGLMSQAVIDILEPVKIKVAQGDTAAQTMRALHGQQQVILQQTAVGQAGQRIKVGQFLNGGFGVFTFVNVFNIGNKVGDFSQFVP